MYVPYCEKAIKHTYKSKCNLERENKIILLIISDGEIWHYLTVRTLGALLNSVTSSHNGDSYCLNCFHSYRTEKTLKKHMNVCQDKIIVT